MSFVLSNARLLAMLEEDVPYGDITTAGLGIGEKRGRAAFRARTTMPLAGIGGAERLMQLAGGRATHRLAFSGAQVEAGAELLRAEGEAAALHRSFKLAQTLME